MNKARLDEQLNLCYPAFGFSLLKFEGSLALVAKRAGARRECYIAQSRNNEKVSVKSIEENEHNIANVTCIVEAVPLVTFV